MSSPAVKEISLTELFSWTKTLGRYLLSKWLVIFSVIILFGILGVAYAWLKKPVYVAEITFATESDNSSQLGIYAGIASQFGVDLGSSSSGIFEGESLMELLKSRTMVEKTLLSPYDKSPSPLMVEVFLNNQDDKWRSKPLLKNMHFEPYPQPADRNRDSIMAKVYDQIVKGELQIEQRDKKNKLRYYSNEG